MNKPKKAIVIHSGGMDSSICLALAKKAYGADQIVSLSFTYGQRHANEIIQARKIAKEWGIDHTEVSLDCLVALTDNALVNHSLAIEHEKGLPPNTLVVGRNGLMAHLGGIFAHQLGASIIYMGIMELETANSGYRDCSREYMDLKQSSLQIDLNDPSFEIRTPLIAMTKEETMALADSLGILDYLWRETISCYEGLPGSGCEKCPACILRNTGLKTFLKNLNTK